MAEEKPTFQTLFATRSLALSADNLGSHPESDHHPVRAINGTSPYGPRGEDLAGVRKMAKTRVLLIGSGGIGTVAALNLQTGQQADVSVVLRSNYPAVQATGFRIDSCDHGILENWRPAAGMITRSIR